ncbi:MAG TPA: hypothetical protein VFY45_16310 [Baekduia sp.]|nr:hypothetical protein [Baekduia sp.]
MTRSVVERRRVARLRLQLGGRGVDLVLSCNALQAAAAQRAKRELPAPLERASRNEHHCRDGAVQEVRVDVVLSGAVVVVRAGESCP